VTFDNCFVIRDLKIIDGNTGLFIAMPSRKLTFHCPRCRIKNHLRSKYCNNCGTSLPSSRHEVGPDGRGKLYADVAHPINAESREMIQNRVVEEYQIEVDRAKLPGYRSRYDDEYDSTSPSQPGKSAEDSRIDSPGRQHPTPHRSHSDRAVSEKSMDGNRNESKQ
jgi:stage V sporulation protein G